MIRSHHSPKTLPAAASPLVLVLWLVLSALVVTGCGDGDTGDEAVDPAARAEAEGTAPPEEPSPTQPPQRFDPDEEVEIEPPSETTVPDQNDREMEDGEGSVAADELERARAEERARRSRQVDTEDID